MGQKSWLVGDAKLQSTPPLLIKLFPGMWRHVTLWRNVWTKSCLLSNSPPHPSELLVQLFRHVRSRDPGTECLVMQNFRNSGTAIAWHRNLQSRDPKTEWLEKNLVYCWTTFRTPGGAVSSCLWGGRTWRQRVPSSPPGPRQTAGRQHQYRDQNVSCFPYYKLLKMSLILRGFYLWG